MYQFYFACKANLHQRIMRLIQPEFKLQLVKDAHVAVALFLPLNKFYQRDVNGIANVSNATTVRNILIRLSLAMDLTEMYIAKLVMEKDGVHTVMVLPVAPVSCKLMV